jgi:GT2 family glycosyltransferase
MISIIIPTYNSKNLLKETLISLFNQSYPSEQYEIIVIDDASTDDTESLFENSGTFRKIKYIKHSKNLGRASTRNTGITNARGDIIIFLDADNVPRDDEFIAEHVRCHEKDSSIVVLGNVMNTQEDLKNPYNRYSWKRQPMNWKEIDYWNLPKNFFFAPSNASVRRNDLLEVGLFDEDFKFYGWEDRELGFRLRKGGLKFVFAPKAITYHKSNISFKTICDRMVDIGKVNAPLLKKKYPDEYKSMILYYSYLEPIDIKKDPLMIIFMKLLLMILTNKVFVRLCEYLVRLIERRQLEITPSSLFRLALAYYYRKGVNLRAVDSSGV